ncbi:hypothetical protein BC834DRAFT_968779 [Gloeopeniophorella convolvens]|nr:hypothetical protein BC834DRAFT_968779 [Gloeopeniophorella convolvens]
MSDAQPTESAPAPALAELPSAERTAELQSNLADIRVRIQAAASASTSPHPPTLVAISKLKPAPDVRACYEAGQRDFGENYAQEMRDKALVLPRDIRWHFVGALQSNKAKALAEMENLHAVQTLASARAADALSRHRAPGAPALRVLLQVNTSGEDSKAGLGAGADAALAELALHVVRACPRLRLVGLMTIGAPDGGVRDFQVLREVRERLEGVLREEVAADGGEWGEEGRLALSMGMSGDFEDAIREGADVVRVGTGIFGERPKKEVKV